MENVFDTLPPEKGRAPTANELIDLAINIQAFIFNVFGSIDNLAWIWVHERNLTKPDGSALPFSWVGLSRGNNFVRNTFSNDFRAYLAELDPWFVHLEGYRHALAHRVPLYVPPYIITPDREGAYNELSRRMSAAIARRDLAEHARLSEEQDALASSTVDCPIY